MLYSICFRIVAYVMLGYDKKSPNESNIFRIRSNSKTADNIVKFCKSRELGGAFLHTYPLRYTAECSLNGLTLHREFQVNQKFKRLTLHRGHLFDRGGFLGLSHQGSWLVGMNVLSGRKVMLMFFRVTPQFATLVHSIILENYSSSGLIQTFFPKNEEQFIGSLVIKEDDVKSSRPESSVSTEVALHVLLPKLCLHFLFSTTVQIVARVHQGKVLRKRYLRVHDNGFLLNNGVGIINLSFSKEPMLVQDGKDRLIYCIMSGEVPFDLRDSDKAWQTKNIELGEWISVQSTLNFEQPNMVEAGKMKFYLSRTSDIGNEKPLLYFARDHLNVEAVTYKLLEADIPFIPNFKFAELQGIIDYESDVLAVIGDCATVSVLSVCELQLKHSKDAEACTNEFFVFRLDFNWDVRTLKAYRGPRKAVCLKRLTYQQAYRNNWFPYPAYPVEDSLNGRFIHNYNMFLGTNLDKLVPLASPCIEFICDENVPNVEAFLTESSEDSDVAD